MATLIALGPGDPELIPLASWRALEAAGPVVAWLVATLFSAVVGLAAGLIVVGVVLGIGRLVGRRPSFTEGGRSPHRAAADEPALH